MPGPKGGKFGWLGAVRRVWRLYRDPGVSGLTKAIFIALAALYLVMPFDLVPEWLFGPLGLVDDAVLVPLILSLIQWFVDRRKDEADDASTQRRHVESHRVD